MKIPNEIKTPAEIMDSFEKMGRDLEQYGEKLVNSGSKLPKDGDYSTEIEAYEKSIKTAAGMGFEIAGAISQALGKNENSVGLDMPLNLEDDGFER